MNEEKEGHAQDGKMNSQTYVRYFYDTFSLPTHRIFVEGKVNLIEMNKIWIFMFDSFQLNIVYVYRYT